MHGLIEKESKQYWANAHSNFAITRRTNCANLTWHQMSIRLRILIPNTRFHLFEHLKHNIFVAGRQMQWNNVFDFIFFKKISKDWATFGLIPLYMLNSSNNNKIKKTKRNAIFILLWAVSIRRNIFIMAKHFQSLEHGKRETEQKKVSD